MNAPDPAPQANTPQSILRNLALGFALIIVLSWVAELLHVPHLLYAEREEFRWLRVLSRTFVLLGIWVWLHLTVRRLLNRLHELEDFLLICSWCRKVGHQGKWLSMEEYFGSRFETPTTHGICPECAAKARTQFEVRHGPL